MKYKELIQKMTLEVKASVCVGKVLWHTNEIPRLYVPTIMMADGPNGLRIETTNRRRNDLEIPTSEIAVCFPTEATLANSWNKNLIYKVGKAIGKEALCKGVSILLGPGVNIKRSPLCGRNFEYFSEDPYLTGTLGISYVNGVQENGVATCVKHFAANNQECNRRLIDVVIDERTLREIYLKAFEMIVKEAKPYSIMSAYDRIDGIYCSDNKKLINDILYSEWNFEGIVITDWSAEDNRVEGIKAGTAIEMPGNRAGIKEQIVEAVKNGDLEEERLDEIVDKILNITFKLADNKRNGKYSEIEDHNLALEAAEDSVVLLKNEDNILPIKNKKIAIIGDFAINPRYQGAGSAKVNPYKLENAYNYFKELGYEFDFAKGYERSISNNNDELLQEAVEVCKNNEVVLIFAGLTEIEEAEGLDRNSLDISKSQNKLIEEICKVNNNVVVVLSNGAPITMPWKDKVKGIITGYLGGETGAKAIVKCIIGKVTPSGKLAETYPIKLEDTPCYNNFPGTDVIVEYKEAIYVGYRYYDKVEKDVLFPFGYGLSYTNFMYSNLKINQNNTDIEVSFKIKNIGNVKGKEIAQVYISKENSNIYRAKKELKGFEKIELESGEEKEIVVHLNKDLFNYYDVKSKKWSIESGKYKILVGKSSKDIVLESEIDIESNDICEINNVPECYKTGHIENVRDEDFEKILGKTIPNKHINISEITDANSLEQIRETKIGKYIYEKEMKRANIFFEAQNVDKGYKIIQRLQKPIKRFYEKKNAKITKEIVDEFIKIAKENVENYDIEFVKLYFDDYVNK